MEKKAVYKKPLVLYLHHCPIEYEYKQYPGLRDLFNELLKKYRVAYFSMNGPTPPNEKLRAGIKVLTLPFSIDTSNSRDKWIKTGLWYLLMPLVVSKLKKLKPDYIISKESHPLIPSVIARLGIPMIIDVEDWWWTIFFGATKIGDKISYILEKIEVSDWAKFKTTVVVHSKTDVDILEEKGMPRERIKVVNFPAYKGAYFPCNADDIRKKLGFGKDTFVVSTHGVIRKSKGYEQILDWWRKLIKIHPNWKLLIIGGAGGEKTLKEKSRRLGIQRNVIMPGWLPTHEDVNKYLNASDCLLVTRRNTRENLGLIPSALFHSLSLGKPTLATGNPAFSEVIEHKKSGYLFEPDNYESFKSLLEYIESHPKEAKKVAKQGIKRADECFSPENAKRKFFDIVDEELSKKLSLKQKII